MKTKLRSPVITLFLLVLSIFTYQPPTVLAQGSLTPPGAPAPMMKTLDQVEPRTAITNLPIIISLGGSYYLTQSFAQNFTSDAITILADNVTVDFCGFTIQQTNATPTIVGVRINATSAIALRNAVVKNGTIAGFAAVGITCLGGRNCCIENLHITECAGGINFQAFGSAGAAGNTFRHCQFTDNTGSGLTILSGASNLANTIESCESVNNTTGFSLAAGGNLIIGCRASGNSINYTIAAGNRGGAVILPTASASAFNGSTGDLGTGTTDPYANLSY